MIISACDLHVALIMDENGSDFLIRARSLVEALHGANRNVKFAIVRLETDRRPLVLHGFSDSQTMGAVISVLDVWRSAPINGAFTTVQSELISASNGAIVLFAGHDPLNPFISDLIFLRNLNVNLVAVVDVQPGTSVSFRVKQDLERITGRSSKVLVNGSIFQIVNNVDC